MWFRVELNKDGSVSSCTYTGSIEANGKYVRYVDADSREQAISFVSKWFKLRERGRRKEQTYREKCKARCVCTACGNPQNSDRIGKLKCLDCMHNSNARTRAILKGECAPKFTHAKTDSERADRAKSYETAKAARTALYRSSAYQRLKVLTEVQGIAEEFSREYLISWLRIEIKKLTPLK